MRSVELMADGLIATVKGYVDQVVGTIRKELADLTQMAAALDRRFAELPVPKDGAPGSSAFQIACLGGFRGSEGEWLESLRGKDVDAETIVTRVLAGIPSPKDGEPGKNAEIDYDRIGEMLSTMVKGAVAALPVPRDADEGAITARVLAQMPKLKDGKDAEVDYARIDADVKRLVDEAVGAMPKPKDGKDGSPGERGEQGLSGKDGADGAPGTNGADGKDGRDADTKELREWFIGELGAELNKLPRPKDGKDADMDAVERMVRGEVAHAILMLPKPKDGEPGKSVTLDDVRPMIDGVIREAVAKIPAPKDGADGLGFDDLSVEYDGERTFAFKFQRGEQKKEFSFKVPMQIYRDVWKAGKEYERGDTVTWDGSTWHANTNTSSRPGIGGGDWTMANKRGQNGKDLTPPKSEPPQVVRIR